MRSPGAFSGRAARQLGQLLRRFPGDPRLWTMKALHAISDGEPERALDCAQRARKLALTDAPADGVEGIAPAIEVLLSVQSLPLAEAGATFDAAYSRVRFGPADADFCFATVTAGLVLAGRVSGRGARLWERVVEMAARGASLPDARKRPYAPFFRAARMIAAEKLANRPPSVEILYRAGLGTIVPRSASKNPVTILGAAMIDRLLEPAA